MKKTLKLIVLAILLITTVVMLTACGDKDSKEDEEVTLIGSWKYKGTDYTYTFNEDGTGDYSAAGNKMEFTYETDGDKISILYEGNTVPFESTYEIKGKKLNIIDSFGEDTIYKRVK